MHSLANLQDLIPTLAGTYIYKQHNPAKVGTNVDLLESVFHLYAYMDVPIYPVGVVFV